MAYRGKIQQNDEYYTTYDSIEKFVVNKCNISTFKNRTIYLNCDDYRKSNFTKYFKDNFERFELKELISTNYDIGDGAYIYTYDGENENIYDGVEDGSFENYEYIIDDKNPIVVTNPPFSKYKSFGTFLFEHDVQFLLVSTQAALCNHMKERINDIYFTREYVGLNSNYEWWDEKETTINGIGWMTNIDTLFINIYSKTNLDKKLEEVPHVITDEGYVMVKRCMDIPNDYYEPILVPISFVGVPVRIRNEFTIDTKTKFIIPKGTYKRLMIRRKKLNNL